MNVKNLLRLRSLKSGSQHQYTLVSCVCPRLVAMNPPARANQRTGKGGSVNVGSFLNMTTFEWPIGGKLFLHSLFFNKEFRKTRFDFCCALEMMATRCVWLFDLLILKLFHVRLRQQIFQKLQLVTRISWVCDCVGGMLADNNFVCHACLPGFSADVFQQEDPDNFNRIKLLDEHGAPAA